MERQIPQDTHHHHHHDTRLRSVSDLVLKNIMQKKHSKIPTYLVPRRGESGSRRGKKSTDSSRELHGGCIKRVLYRWRRKQGRCKDNEKIDEDQQVEASGRSRSARSRFSRYVCLFSTEGRKKVQEPRFSRDKNPLFSSRSIIGCFCIHPLIRWTAPTFSRVLFLSAPSKIF